MKNIHFPKVERVSIAIIREGDQATPAEPNWTAYVVNFSDDTLVNLLVATKGYGEVDGQPQRTSVLRHLIKHLAPGQAAVIERVDPQVFGLANEFWLSFYKEADPTVIYDKKYVFMPGSIAEEHVIRVPGFDMHGIVHD